MTHLADQPHFIDGTTRQPAADRWFTTLNPATGAPLARAAQGDAQDVDAAVAAAHQAFDGWADMTGAERGRILTRAATILRDRNDEIARLETLDTGKPIAESSVVDVASAADCLEYFGGVAASIAGQQVDLGPNAFGYVRREPLGVCAGIGAWNYPIQIAAWKAAPALACGNTMVFKPSEMTPVTAGALAQAFADAGLPPGVFNIVQGDRGAGQALVAHPGVAKVSLTGEVGTGRKIMAAAAETLKHVTMELGGKSPLIIFADADLDNAVSAAMMANFYTQGEVCSNGTRVFVARALLDRFVDALAARTAKLKIGDPLDPETHVGALISEDHMRRVLGFIDQGVAEGARLVIGGRRAAGLDGWFVEPAIFVAEDDDLTISRDEIFGPVMTILPFDDEDEVLARANATEFGLAAGVFTSDLARAHRTVRRLQAGVCWINNYNITPIELPFGGVKQSGLGRENGTAAIEHYTQLKTVYVELGDVDCPYPA
ncbi:MAG: betaine-aldehyde dehydrogenase [Pseudomonadota bacterium]